MVKLLEDCIFRYVFSLHFELQFLIFHFEFLIFSASIFLSKFLNGLGPTFLTSSMNCVITWANLCPSAAENHSNLSLSSSIPNSRISCLVISNCSAAR